MKQTVKTLMKKSNCTPYKTREGAIALPMALACLMLLFASGATFAILRNWNGLVRLQYSLDRCTLENSKKWVKVLNLIEKQNLAIRSLRLALSQDPEPVSRAGLTATLSSTVLLQEANLFFLRAQKSLWVANQSCNLSEAHPLFRGDFYWSRQLPDAIGPQALEWQSSQPYQFNFFIKMKSRSSSSKIEREKGIVKNWKASWQNPLYFGTNIF